MKQSEIIIDAQTYKLGCEMYYIYCPKHVHLHKVELLHFVFDFKDSIFPFKTEF